MRLKVLTNVLLIVYGFAIMGYSIVETGHGLLHSLKNKVHYHDPEHHHNLADHHHVQLTEEESNASDKDLSIPFYSYFIFFEQHRLVISDLNSHVSYSTQKVDVVNSISSIPFVPPPIS